MSTADESACLAARARYPLLHFVQFDGIIELQTSKGAGQLQRYLEMVSDASKLEVDAAESVVAVWAKDERLALEPPVTAKDRAAIEVLADVLAAMSAAVRREVKAAANAQDLTIPKLAKLHLQHVSTLLLHANFTKAVNSALDDPKALSGVSSAQDDMVRGAVRYLKAAQGPALALRRARNLLHVALHHAQQAAQLASSPGEARQAWAGMLQFAVSADGAVAVKLGEKALDYGFHYSSGDRLIRTPETDVIFRAVVAGQAAGATYVRGPAGSGKTEHCKELAYELGLLPIVVNCSDMCDHVVYENAWKGAKGTGVLLIFDEFNRSEFACAKTFLEKLLAEASPSAPWVACTWNPGYAGRSELPTAAHMPVVDVTIPNQAALAKAMLASEGFECFEQHGIALAGLFSWAIEHMSKDCAYDWRFRTLVAVVNVAGKFLRAGATERAALRHALDVTVSPRVARADRALWSAELDRVFGSPSEPREQLMSLAKYRHGLLLLAQDPEAAMSKVEAAAKAHGVELLTVKSSKIDKESGPSDLASMLYGHFDTNSRDWSDGTFTTAIRQACCLVGEPPVFVVVPASLCGDLSAVELEGVNTLLDGNKMLCLASGERIVLKPNVNVLYVNLDTSIQSPATLSRLGIVRFD